MHFSPTLKKEKDKCANPLKRPRHWFRKNHPNQKVLWDTQYGISGWKKNPIYPSAKNGWSTKNQPLIVKRSNHFSTGETNHLNHPTSMSNTT